jgi:lichenan operon transcriptional antiterminator
MEKKYYRLVHYLAQAKTPQKSFELATELGVSARTIKNYVAEINKIYNVPLILAGKNGYLLNNSEFQKLLEKESDNNIPQDDSERSFYILRQIILSKASVINVFDLCDNLYISYSKLTSLITKMNKTYSNFNVHFTISHSELKIVGQEKGIRKLASYIINKETKESFLSGKQFSSVFNKIDYKELMNILVNTCKKYGFFINEFAKANIAIHLMILLSREQQGHPLITSDYSDTESSNINIEFLNDLCDELEKRFLVNLNQYERAEISILLNANINYSYIGSKKELSNFVKPGTINLAKYYTDQINKRYLVDLSNSSFQIPFIIHLNNLLLRIESERYTSNPMSEIIQKNNPIIYEIAAYIASDLSEKFQRVIPSDEISFLAMHIGAEIERQNESSTKIISYLLSTDYLQMNSKISNFLMVNFSSKIDLEASFRDEADLINYLSGKESNNVRILFTTMPLSSIIPKMVSINILPFNLDSQIGNIKRQIIETRDLYENEKLKRDFYKFFSNDYFVISDSQTTKDEVIKNLCSLLQDSGNTDESFYNSVIKRESLGSTAFGQIAIPHSIEMNAIKTSVAVLIDKSGIIWDKSSVNVVLLLAINTVDRKTFRELYESLISIFSDQIMLNKIINCSSYDEFKKLITN